MKRDAFSLPLDFGAEKIVDNFAGGGGASTGIERAFGRPIDIAINHNDEALAMHAVNHPQTRHYCEDVFDIHPGMVTQQQPIGLAWFSPDCTHHSKAKGGKPRDKKIRGLAWITLKWAAFQAPRCIALENVEEFADWGPIDDHGQPIKSEKGRTFRAFIMALTTGIPIGHPDTQEIYEALGADFPMERLYAGLGYKVEWRVMRACDFGAPTIRKRLYIFARRDGLPIVWPAKTHGDPATSAVQSGLLKPWRTAADCIDFSIPCPSIFERARPLAEATQRRIARGIVKFVIEAENPFIVPAERLAGATLIQTGYGERPGQAPRVPGLDKPLGTLVAGGTKHALVMAFLAKHYGGNYDGPGIDLDGPMSTVTTQDHHALVTSNIVKLRGTSRDGQRADEPLHTISAGGTHHAEVRAFLIKFYSQGGQWQDMREPMHTVPTKDRMGLVTIHGDDYAIVDIGMRMLTPRELARAQGFPDSYVLDPVFNGKPLSKSSQVRMIGNSVCPDVAEALIRANFTHERQMMGIAA